MALNEGAEFYALVYLEKEPYPEIEIQLFADKAPTTVNNFIHLVRNGFYDGLTFHHVVPGELVQTGDPTGTGDGGPGYVIEDEFHSDLRHHAAGVVAMASSEGPPGSTNGSQFYITLAPLPDRDGLNPDDSRKDCAKLEVSCHSVFGKIIKGMQLIDADSEPWHPNAIRQGDVIQKIEIIAQYPADSPHASTPADCTNRIVVPNPEASTKLVQQCEALLKLKRTLGGDAKLNWSKNIPIWTWHGIHLADDGVGIGVLDLHRRGLTGTIPPEIGELESLQFLDLSHNQLSGEIPDELTQLSKLRLLVLSENRLTGSIPPEISNLTNLTDLRLFDNQLSGPIPPEIGQLTGLTIFAVSGNQLTGNIPEELGGLTNAWWFSLGGNYFDGCIPDIFKERDIGEATLLYCNDPLPWRIPESTFDGGIDLAVTYIERLPRYRSYKASYHTSHDWCPYPFEEDKGPVGCPRDANTKYSPAPGDTVQLIAHIRNFGDTDVEQFDYVWRVEDKTLETGKHDGIVAGGSAEISIDYVWPEENSNPVVSFEVDTEDLIDEIFEVNNEVHDWIKGHTLGIYFSEEAYETLKFSAEKEGEIQSPEHWFRKNLDRLNEMMIEAGVNDRVRTELFLIADERNLDSRHDLKWVMDGWWGFWHDTPAYSLDGYRSRMEIDGGLLHEMLHQLGVIDIYQMTLWFDQVQLSDVNRPGRLAGCGLEYWNIEGRCFVFSADIHDIMVDHYLPYIGAHTVGGLRANAGHRRGFFGEYLFDTPEKTSIKIVDKDGHALGNVELRFYQSVEMQIGDHWLPFVDDVVEFTVTTDDEGVAELPNRGITGIVTPTGHQLRPNPFGLISVVGNNGIFIIEMTSDECTNYEWLTLVELNLAYWDGQTEQAEFTKTLRCPPPR